MTTTLADRFLRRLVIVGCSQRKTPTATPVPALELYQGGAVVPLRTRIGMDARARARVRILSAEHGIVHADAPLLPYDRPLDPERAHALRGHVAACLNAELIRDGVPDEVLIVVEPLYLVLVADLLARPSVRVYWMPDPATDWSRATAVLDGWGWP